jgi:hypothetical protein
MVDCQEACNGDPRKFFPGECGCGIPDTDANSNGTVDCKDVQPSLSGPSITSKSRVIKVSFPPDGSMSYQYSFKFLDKKGRVLKKGTSKVNWGSQLSFAAPSKATNFVISYLAKGPGFKDYQSPEFSKAVK